MTRTQRNELQLAQPFLITRHPEREAQQWVVLENNRDGAYANSTDFCFCDM